METSVSNATPTRESLIAALNVKLLNEQNLVMALVAGAGASIAGALIWMGITIATQMHIGLVAIAVGAGVGYAIRYAGKGVTKIYGFIGAVFTLLSCVAGEVFSVIQMAASTHNLGFFDALTQVDYSLLLPAIFENSSPITYLIYGIGVWEGYKFSFRRLTQEDLQQAGLGTTAPATPPAA